MLIPTPSRRLMREYQRKERLELKLAVCKEKIRVLEERDRPKYPPTPKPMKRKEVGSGYAGN